MDMRSYEAGQDQKVKNKSDNESGSNHKASTGKEVEVAWACLVLSCLMYWLTLQWSQTVRDRAHGLV